MIIVEVKDSMHRTVERRCFKLYSVAVDWFEKTKELYGKGVRITFC